MSPDHLPTPDKALPLSPQERLALSRQALMHHMDGDSKRGRAGAKRSSKSTANDDFQDDYATDEDREDFGGPWNLLRLALTSWWRQHPASIATDIASPLLQRFAQDKPFQLIGIAAGVGAAAVLIRPWRLISIGSVLWASLKSSDLTGIVASMLSSSSTGKTRKKHHE